MEVKHNERSRMHGEDKAYIEWLEAQEGNYQSACRDAFLIFCDFLREVEGFEDPTGDKILAMHIENQRSKDKKVKHYFADLIPKFHSWLKTDYRGSKTGRPLTHNSASATVNPIRGFFSEHREGLKLTKSQIKKISPIEVRKKYHAYKRDELAKMARVADLEEKAVILLGTCEGIRVGDFVAQLRQPIIEAFMDQGEFPIEFEIETEKEGVVAVAHITEECWQALQDYWANMPESEFVFPSGNGDRHISQDRANDVLKNTWLRAYPERTDTKIRFHELRSYKMSALSNAGVMKWHIKRMVGKKLNPDILDYLTSIDLKADFAKALDAFTLTGLAPTNHEAVEQLVQTTNELVDRVGQQEMIIRALSKENVELRDKLKTSESRMKAEFVDAVMRLAEIMKEEGIGLSEAIHQLYLVIERPSKWDAEFEARPLSEYFRERLLKENK